MVLCETSGVQKSKVVIPSLVIRQADMVKSYNTTHHTLHQSNPAFLVSSLSLFLLPLPSSWCDLNHTLPLTEHIHALCLGTFAVASPRTPQE